MGFAEFLEQLPTEDDAPFSYAGLSELSGISRDEALELAGTWGEWPDERVVALLSRLGGLAEDDALLEFENVFAEALSLDQAHARSLAVNGLAECSDRRILARLSTLLSEDDSEEVRSAVAVALAHFAVMARDGKLQVRDVERLRAALDEALGRPGESLNVRRRALEAIGAFPDDEAAGHIRGAYASAEELLVQSAIFAMGRSSDERWLPEVLRALRSRSAAVRYEAAQALGGIGGESHAEHLEAAIDDDDAQVAIAAAEALARLGGAAARKLLNLAAQSDRSTVAEAALNALEILAEEDVLFEGEPGMLGIVGGELAGRSAVEEPEELGDEFELSDDFGSDRARWN